MPLFDRRTLEPDIVGMVRRAGHETSVEAAQAIAPRRTELHDRIMRAFEDYFPMTDEELENLPDFKGYGPSTIRKRRSELFQQHALIAVGTRMNSRGRQMVVWGLFVEQSDRHSRV